MRTTRRQFVQMSTLAALAASAAPLFAAERPSTAASTGMPTKRPDPWEALRLLREGNERFVGGKGSAACTTPADFAKVAAGQEPFAAVVACADSRTAPETVFDQGIGQLFTVRVAGNVVTGSGPTMKGSLEYAVAELGVSLILVLGHTGCGAMKSALKYRHSDTPAPGEIDGLLKLIYPSVDRATAGHDGSDILQRVTADNVHAGVERLKQLDPIIAPAVRSHKVMIVGGIYDLGSGRVDML